MKALESDAADQIVKLQQKAAEESQKAWQKTEDQISGLITSQVDGLIKGTETVRQAFSKMSTSIIKDIAKYTIKWTIEHAGAVAAQIAGNQAVAASQASADAGGIASVTENALKVVTASAGQTFAAVTAWMAPAVGPAAPAFGAAAEATVLSAGLAGLYDTGTWNIPRDQVAGLHAGEMVIPQRGGVADEFRAFMSNGGFSGSSSTSSSNVAIHPTTNFHVSAINSGSVSQWLKGNSRQMMSAMDEAVRHGAALGLRRLATPR